MHPLWDWSMDYVKKSKISMILSCHRVRKIICANTHLDTTYVDDENLHDSIKQMLEIIYTDFNFDLRHDEILYSDLFRHLKSIFTSKLYDLNSNNPT